MSDESAISPFVQCDEIPWGQWSTLASAPTDEGFRELAFITLEMCHERDVTIAALTKHVEDLQAEISHYIRSAMQSPRLYRRRPSKATDADPGAASRNLGLDV